MGSLTSTQGMRFSADARWLRCPGGHAGDSARCLAPLPPPGFHARILLDAGVFFHGTHGSPGARRAFSGVFSKPGWLHTRRKRLFDLARSLDGRFGLADGVRRGDSARFSPCRAPKRRRPRDAPGSRRRRRGRDAEYSGFCTVQAGVRWDGKGCPRLFMHGTSENMQDNRAPCAGCPDWARHTPTFAASLPRRARIRRRGQLWACRRLCERQGCCGACARRGRSCALGAGARRPHAVACHARCRRRSGPQYLRHHHALNTYSATI